MKVFTFKRGIHPSDEKIHTADRAIIAVPSEAGTIMTFPFSQHLGAPAKPIVEVGQRVLRGEKIAESGGYVSSPVYTSVSGTVTDIVDTGVFLPNGNVSGAVIIESDGKEEEHETMNKQRDYKTLSKDEILELIKEAGIVGMGGAGFPTHVKLNPPPDKVVDTIILNGAECEPYLTNDYRAMIEQTDWLIEGLQIVLHTTFNNAKGIIGIETNKPDAIEKLSKACENISNIEVRALKPKYPQGSEKQLIYALTGKEVPSGGLPADVGCVVINVETAIAIQRAVVRGKPLMARTLTLSGDMVNNPGNYKVKIGSSYNDLIEFTGGLKGRPYKIISGGPMMGVALFSLDVPVIKTSSSILCVSEKLALLHEEQPCIRCARCLEHCPMGLMPLELNKYVAHHDYAAFEENNGLDCVECGSCSYVCPSKRHLAQSIRAARRSVMESKRK